MLPPSRGAIGFLVALALPIWIAAGPGVWI
jgi:hypothetical protein